MKIVPKTVVYIILLLLYTTIDAQNSEFKLHNYHPISPSAFEFLKYTDMPVDKYNGTADISIPIDEINVDNIKLPINISYHTGGIRVNEEASWVGIGWNLTFGSIVQEINDVDDYGTNTVRLQPDWIESPVPSNYSQKMIDLISLILTPGYNDPVPVVPPKPLYSYEIYTAYPAYPTPLFYLPINGNRDNQLNATDLVNNPNFDSEPDIFTANFLGVTLRFIRDPKSNKIIVLNKQGYDVIRSNDVYEILTPNGEQVWFEQFNTVISHSETSGGIGNTGFSTTNPLPSSKIWMLTKIITKNKKQISFTYNQGPTVNNYPAYSEKWDTVLSSVTNTFGGNYSGVEGFTSFPVNGIGRTFSYSSETRFYLNSITFPNGEIDFITSSRNDLLGGLKLDAIQMVVNGTVIRKSSLSYIYSDASSVGGNKYQPSNSASFGNTPDLRLQLTSINDNNGGVYNFTYNSTPLPSKNSLAVDFWGFYNGQLSNSSLIPNPTRLNSSQLSNISGLQSNGNNNSANLTYAQAGILTAIKYPTGGKTVLEYELNTFDNYVVPDFSTTTNTLSHGAGLRINAINYQATDNVNAVRTIFSYIGGKASSPLQLCRQYAVNALFFPGGTSPTNSNTTYQVAEINSHGFYSSNSLSSGNYVGYDEVIEQQVNGAASLGRTESYFVNNPDNVANTAGASPSVLNAELPSTKKILTNSNGIIQPTNGSEYLVLYYDDGGNQIKKISKTYLTTPSYSVSDLYYGTRFFGYSSIFFGAVSANAATQMGSVPRTLAGYYPIYDVESEPLKTETTDYTLSGQSLASYDIYYFDYYDQLVSLDKGLSDGGHILQIYTHPTSDLSNSTNQNLVNAHRFSEVVSSKKIRYFSDNSTSTEIENYNREYAVLADKIVITKTVENKHPGTGEFPSIVTYDKYDATNANPLQFTSKGLKSSLMWDYNGEYVIAEIKNAASNEAAYTSFEADGSGNWSIPSTARAATGYTGSSAYLLSNGNITTTIANVAKSYVVSYWSQNGSVNVNGVAASQGATHNGWTYFEHIIPAGATSVTVSGTFTIDELRMYPVDAQMQTYTYLPLIGISSQCDAKNYVTYYEYDAQQRLYRLRDQDRNIIKRYDYKYQQVP